jgi:uncharacterized protein YabN with tetrapyrrole methylase and pyrophosphatase domain
MSSGSLTIVGSGITALSHFTLEGTMAIKLADVTFYVVADTLTEDWIKTNSQSSRSLTEFYVEGQHRAATYDAMTRTIVAAVRSGQRVCAVFYGHPGVFVNPSHAAFRALLQEGYPVSMQAGISAEDCLFADLGVDPSTNGCLSIEATNFLIYKRHFDISVALIIWQIGMVGDPTHNPKRTIKREDILVQKLSCYYPIDHRICVYEAPLYSVSNPRLDWCTLGDLPQQEINGITTLFVPPLGNPPYDTDFMTALNLRLTHITLTG